MRLSEVLEQARKHVAGGWREPMSTTSSGVICAPTDEGIANFCVADAIELAAAGDFVLQVDAELALVRQLQLRGEQRSLASWLEHESTLHGDVLQLFSRAVAHHRAGEGR